MIEKKCGADDDTGIENALCRTVVVFFAKNGGFERFTENNEIVDCSQCGGAGVGDPFQQIVIKNGYFTIEQFYGACTKTTTYTTFKYSKQDNDFFLHKFSSESYDCRESENKDGEIQVKDKIVETTKDFGKIKFADYSE